MSKLRISDAPLLPDVSGLEKIPTGGRGDLAISMDQVKTFAQGGLPKQIEDHINDTENPHQVNKSQVGLGNVDNTSDLDKPVSTAQQEALNLKADKVTTYTKIEVDSRLGLKADKTYVDTNLNLKADKTYVDTNLNLKADKTAVYSKSSTLPTYYTKEDGVNSVTGVANDAYFNVRSTDEDTVLVEYQNVGGSAVATGKSYPSGSYVETFVNNLALINSSTQDITQALKDAVSSNKSEYTLPEGDYTVTESINIGSSFVLKSNNATITGTGVPLFNTTASIELHNITPKGFTDIIEVSGAQQIKKIGFYNCDLSQSESVLRWNDSTRTGYLHRLDMLMCDVSEMSKYVMWCEAKIRDVYIGGNTFTNNVRYLLRRLFGDANERYCENVYIYKNIVRGLTNGTFTGASAVARCWQVAAERIFLLNNHYENVTTTDISAENCTIAYTDAKYLIVSGNTHKNCGAESSSGYLYHDKSVGGRSISNKYLTNTFEQDSTQDYNQGIIQSVALSSEFISNTYDGVRGICSYLGWNTARNITYAFNKHLNLKGNCAVRFYGDLETINHIGNIYDGITNDKDVVDSGRRGAWFVDILKSSAELAPRSFKSSGNTYKNLSYTGASTSPVVAAMLIGSHESMDKFSVADFFHDMSVGVQFRSTAQMQTFVLDKSEFYNVANPYQFQAGASYKPANFVLGDNLGLKTKARGKVTFVENQTSVTVPHGLFAASAANLWVQISGTELETFRVAGALAASFDIRRAAAATTPTVYWEAEVLP